MLVNRFVPLVVTYNRVVLPYRPWDVCAGIVIAQEAGCIVTGSHAAFDRSCHDGTFGEVTTEILTGRKYVVVRAIADISVSDFFPPSQLITEFLCHGYRSRKAWMRKSE